MIFWTLLQLLDQCAGPEINMYAPAHFKKKINGTFFKMLHFVKLLMFFDYHLKKLDQTNPELSRRA